MKTNYPRMWKDTGKTLVLSLIGGALLSLVPGVPMPWLLGPICIIALYTYFTGVYFYWPPLIRNMSLILVGYSMGRPFTWEAGTAIANQWGFMLGATFLTILTGIGVGIYTHKRTKINLLTCLMGCSPGGLTQMVLIADEIENVDTTAVTLMQTIRLLFVIFTVPFLAYYLADPATAGPVGTVGPTLSWETLIPVAAIGGIVAKKLHIPTPWMLGPFFTTAAYVLSSGETAPPVSDTVFNIARLCLGAYIGCRMDLRRVREYKQLGSCLVFGGFAVLSVSLLAGFIVAELHGEDWITAFLGTAPGGLSEMALLALGMGADVLTVTAYQLTRLLAIMLGLPPLFLYIDKRCRKSNDSRPS